MKVHILFALFLLAAHVARAQEPTPPIRVATYQLESYAARPSADRDAALHDVLRSLHADILLVQGIAGTEAFDNFFGSAFLGSVERSMSVPFSGSTGNAMFYNAAAVTLAGHRVIQTTPVGIDEFVIVPRGSADTLHIFTCGLASIGGRRQSDDRLAAARAILKETAAIPATQHYMFAGELRAYGADDPAYVAMLAETAAGGGFADPLAPIADWSRTATYAPSKGVDAGRFDMMLLSRSLALRYVAGSYGVPGAAMAASLRRASAHLPVYADFTFPAATAPAPYTPLQTALPFAIRQRPTAFAQPKPSATDFGGVMLQKSLEEPSIDLFGTTFSLASGQENQRKPSIIPGKWWGPPPGAPEAPSGRGSQP